MRISILLILFCLCALFSVKALAQQDTSKHEKLNMLDDSTALKMLPELNVEYNKEKMTRRQYRRYTRLVRYVKTTYPYAKMTAKLVAEVNDTLHLITDKKEQKRYVKRREKELFKEFEKPMRKMTITQGLILMKLIDRECQQTSYELVKFYRGSFTALFWQGIARFFGTNLKVEYDGKGKDRNIEHIVQLIDKGLI